MVVNNAVKQRQVTNALVVTGGFIFSYKLPVHPGVHAANEDTPELEGVRTDENGIVLFCTIGHGLTVILNSCQTIFVYHR